MKFWNKSAESADIFIYGEIVSEQWFDTDVTAKSFLDDLKSFGGRDVTIHLNSGGGDCFAALAIYNTLKNYSGKVNVSIEGLCASAATIIACGGSKITIAANSLMMIHNPSVGLSGFFDEIDIDKVKNSLSAVKSTLIQTYQTRTGKSESELDKLLSAETWFTAAEAIENGFADEILGEISSRFDDAKKILFVNKLSVDCRKFDCNQLREKWKAISDKNSSLTTYHLPLTPDSTAIERTNTMDDKSILSKIKDLLSGKKDVDEPEKVGEVVDVAAIRAKEIERVKSLAKLRDGTAAVDAIVDLAIRDGQEAEKIAPYIDAVKNSNAKVEKTTQAILNLIEDNLKSGAEGVGGSAEEVTDADKRKAQADLIAKFANEGGKVKR